MSVRRLATALLLSGVAVVAAAIPAFAHAKLIASDPAQGAALAAPPQQVKLTFNESVTPAANPVTVTGPDGASWTVGQLSTADAVVTAPVQPSGPAGPYTLTYRVVSADGYEITGTVAFTLTTAATTTTPTTTTPAVTTTTTAAPTTTVSAATPASDPDDGVPIWVWLLGAAVVLAAGVVVALRARRS